MVFKKDNKFWDNDKNKSTQFKKGHISKFRGIPRTEEVKDKIRQTIMKNKDLRLQMSKRMKNYRNSVGVKEKSSKWIKKYHDSPEVKDKYSKMMKEQNKNPIIAKRRIDGLKKWHNNPENKKKLSERMKEMRRTQVLPIKDTTIEVKIQDFLKQLGIEYFTHQYMKIEHGYQCDILIPSMNLVIECDGDYWHKYPVGREIDHVRTSELIENGFKVLRLWEFEIRAMDVSEFKEMISNNKIR